MTDRHHQPQTLPAIRDRPVIALSKRHSPAKGTRTGGENTYFKVKLGRITIAEPGPQTLELQPVAEAWTPVRLRSIQLVPAASVPE